MPISIETIKKPVTDHDYQHLLKIYHDFPDIYFSQFSSHDSSKKNIIDYLLNNESIIAYAGRFNGQLITNLFTLNHGKEIEILGFCVRDITRKRGVANLFLKTLYPKLTPDKHTYIAYTQQDTDSYSTIMHLADKFGFKPANHDPLERLGYTRLELNSQ